TSRRNWLRSLSTSTWITMRVIRSTGDDGRRGKIRLRAGRATRLRPRRATPWRASRVQIGELVDASLFSTAQSLDSFRDQHHASARSCLCAIDHLHDYDAAVGE